MSEENNQQKAFTSESMSDEEIRAKQIHKLALAKKVKEISPGEWLLTQEILQDIEAGFLVSHKDGKKPPVSRALELLRTEIENRYSHDTEVKELLLESLPNDGNIRRWRQMDGWDEAVWAKLRSGNMFNNENRFAVIDALYKKSLQGDTTAAKIWLTLSGDYSDKIDLNTDKRIEAYREINQILHRKKE